MSFHLSAAEQTTVTDDVLDSAERRDSGKSFTIKASEDASNMNESESDSNNSADGDKRTFHELICVNGIFDSVYSEHAVDDLSSDKAAILEGIFTAINDLGWVNAEEPTTGSKRKRSDELSQPDSEENLTAAWKAYNGVCLNDAGCDADRSNSEATRANVLAPRSTSTDGDESSSSECSESPDENYNIYQEEDFENCGPIAVEAANLECPVNGLSKVLEVEEEGVWVDDDGASEASTLIMGAYSDDSFGERDGNTLDSAFDAFDLCGRLNGCEGSDSDSEDRPAKRSRLT